jgi:predicted nucleotidyltransferase component of viral defense system
MKQLEMKNHLALETAKLIFQNNIDVVFIGGTALNTFYVDYRYSEDLDLGYLKDNKKSVIEKLLQEHGYDIQRTDFKHRDIISLEGVSIKMDVIEFKKKYNGFAERMIGGVNLRTLTLEEFAVEKMISFFTREEAAGMARDGYDLYALEKTYGSVLDIARKAKDIIRKNIVSLDYNLDLFESDIKKAESAVAPYLRKPVEVKEVLDFLKSLRGVLK